MSVPWDKTFISDFINSLLLTDTQGVDGIDCSRSKKREAETTFGKELIIYKVE